MIIYIYIYTSHVISGHPSSRSRETRATPQSRRLDLSVFNDMIDHSQATAPLQSERGNYGPNSNQGAGAGYQQGGGNGNSGNRQRGGRGGGKGGMSHRTGSGYAIGFGGHGRRL